MMTSDLLSFKQKALQWANQFEVCCYLDSNGFTDPYGNYDLLLAVGAKSTLEKHTGKAFDALEAYYNSHKTWMFGLLSYDLKNEIEQLQSENRDDLQFPDLFFFIPEYLIAIKENRIEILLGDAKITETIFKVIPSTNSLQTKLHIESRINKAKYLQKINDLKQHINRGNIYEVTFCQEFFAKEAAVDPLSVYTVLKNTSPTPFSGFFKIKDQYILSASPERYLRKKGPILISQPIKGTAKRSGDPIEDELLKEALQQNGKEQTENVMIVDLVRNDLTKNAVFGSVKVDELFGIYSFAQVHQMISTISCELDPKISIIDAIKNTFPMGSMTGAPKVKAMELIEEFEEVKRGAYSGSIGYFTPEGDFDFNVIIRSILYDKSKKILSFQVGGAITYASDAEAEYEECMLKASAIIKTLKGPDEWPF